MSMEKRLKKNVKEVYFPAAGKSQLTLGEQSGAIGTGTDSVPSPRTCQWGGQRGRAASQPRLGPNQPSRSLGTWAGVSLGRF